MASDFGVALAQLNLIVGDLPGNQRRITDSAAYARDTLNCRFVVFPELAISGYPPEDLLQRPAFVSDCEAILKKPGYGRSWNCTGGWTSASPGRQTVQRGIID